VKRISLALLGMFLVSAGAQAAGKTGWYVGGGIGWSTIETNSTPDMISGNDTCADVDRTIGTGNAGDGNGWTAGNNNSGNGNADQAGWTDADCYADAADYLGSVKENPIGGDIFIGWEFIPNWSIELRGILFGKASQFDNVISDTPFGGGSPVAPPEFAVDEEVVYKQDVSMQGVDLAARYHWMFSDKWGLSFMLGWAFLKAEYEQFAESTQFNPEAWPEYMNAGNLTPPDNLNPYYRPSAQGKESESDNGVVAGIGAVINTTEHTFIRIEYNYYGVDFNNTLKKPRRVGLDIGYQF